MSTGMFAMARAWRGMLTMASTAVGLLLLDGILEMLGQAILEGHYQLCVTSPYISTFCRWHTWE
jgi:hypothetical protein